MPETTKDERAQLEDLAHERDAALARVAELERFVADLASHGLRCDLTPTLNHSSPQTYADGMLDYLRKVDASIRSAARKLVPHGATPYGEGRPGPTNGQVPLQITRGTGVPIGYIVGYRDPHGEWWISFDGKPFTHEAATDDLHDACNEVPGVDWRVLTVYDETGEPYQAQEVAGRG